MLIIFQAYHQLLIGFCIQKDQDIKNRLLLGNKLNFSDILPVGRNGRDYTCDKWSLTLAGNGVKDFQHGRDVLSL